MGNPVRADGVASMRTSPFLPRFGLFNLGTAVVVVRWARCGRCGTSATAAQNSSAVARMLFAALHCRLHGAYQTSSF
jgi:hypothetical protein